MASSDPGTPPINVLQPRSRARGLVWPRATDAVSASRRLARRNTEGMGMGEYAEARLACHPERSREAAESRDLRSLYRYAPEVPRLAFGSLGMTRACATSPPQPVP